MISKKLFEAIKLAPMKNYRIAQAARLHPSTLSKLLNGIDEAKAGDPRIVRVAKVLGLRAEDCFEEDRDDGA